MEHEPAALGARRVAATAAIKAACLANVDQAVSDLGPGDSGDGGGLFLMA